MLSTMDYWERSYNARASRIPDEKLASEVAIAHLRGTWEAEIKAISTQLSRAKSRLNSLCPIYKLPTELLAYIFEILTAVRPVLANLG